MPIHKRFVVLFWLLILNSMIGIAIGQNPDSTKDSYDAKIDSLVRSMDRSSKINQLMLVRINIETWDSVQLLQNFGAVWPEIRQPTELWSFSKKLRSGRQITPLLFASLSDDQIGIATDSVPCFGSALTFSAIAEPHLMYETGELLAEQCRILGIDGLRSTDGTTVQLINRRDWRLLEINQGFRDHGLLSIDQFPAVEYDSAGLLDLINGENLTMIMLDEADLPRFREHVAALVGSNSIDSTMLTNKVRQLLELKMPETADLDQLDIHIEQSFASIPSDLFREELAAASITVLRNDGSIFPINSLENKRIASLTVGKQNNDLFNDLLDNYTAVDHHRTDYNATDHEFADLLARLNSYDLVICAFYESEFLSTRLNEAQGFVIFQEWLQQSKKVIAVYFGNPALLNYNNLILSNETLILSYEDSDHTNRQIPQMIFGARDIGGVLPLTINDTYEKGSGAQIKKLGRFMYTYPESVDLDAMKLSKIDSLVEEAIRQRAIPGCQVLVARNNCVVYKKSFGFHTYDSLRKVSDDDLYDLASVTKVSGALPGLMKLYEGGRFDLDATMGTYLRYFRRGNKKNLTYREILAHQAGLVPWIPYWQTTMRKNGKYRRKTLSTSASDDFPYMITDRLYVHEDYKKKIFKQIKKSSLGEKKYLYSGLTFYVFPDLIEAITGEDYQEYIYNNFYRPLGATTLTYNPLDRFSLDEIVQTEYDSLFRKTQIHGSVHDEGAALMHGVSSNAGLFANANDLAKLFQMYCNYGKFGGEEYLKSSTVLEFSRWQYPKNNNRRALGFDRPLLQPHDNGNTAKSVSQISFGHTGFTGTFAWADPYYNLVYIFLSNRVYPTRRNTKLYDMNVRTNIQEAIYEAMMD